MKSLTWPIYSSEGVLVGTEQKYDSRHPVPLKPSKASFFEEGGGQFEDLRYLKEDVLIKSLPHYESLKEGLN